VKNILYYFDTVIMSESL